MNEAGWRPSDDEVSIIIDNFPFYFKKMNDTTHFYMANDPSAFAKGAAVAHHVGQHRGETYYNFLVDWLKGKISSKKLNGMRFGSKR